MRVNIVFLFSLIISIIWHLILGEFFDVSLSKKEEKRSFFPVYYIGAERSVSTSGSILPSLELPSLKFPEISLHSSSPVLLKPVMKVISFSPPLQFARKEKVYPSFRFPLPSVPSKKGNLPEISWEGEERKILSFSLPSYPPEARRKGMEGTVEIEFCVNRNGEVENVTVRKSSGYSLLDTLSIENMYRWKFIPSNKRDKGMVKFIFELER